MTDAPLTERKRKDREALALRVQELARAAGAASKVVAQSPRLILLEIEAPGGLCVQVGFDSQAVQPDVHVLSWHMSLDANSETYVSPKFFSSFNEYHFKKATSVARGSAALLEELRRVLEGCANGEAYAFTFPGRLQGMSGTSSG